MIGFSLSLCFLYFTPNPNNMLLTASTTELEYQILHTVLQQQVLLYYNIKCTTVLQQQGLLYYNSRYYCTTTASTTVLQQQVLLYYNSKDYCVTSNRKTNGQPKTASTRGLI